MHIVHVWLLVVYGITGCGHGNCYYDPSWDNSDIARAPTIVIDNLSSKQECVDLGKCLSIMSGSTWRCTGINKVR